MKPEAAIQRAIVQFLEIAIRPPCLFTAFPAGGGGKARGAQLKAAGLKPGWPDLLVVGPARGGINLIGIEVKSAIGRQSYEQMVIQRAFVAAGAWYSISRSVEDVERILLDCGIPLHARVST